MLHCQKSNYNICEYNILISIGIKIITKNRPNWYWFQNYFTVNEFYGLLGVDFQNKTIIPWLTKNTVR